MTLAFALFLIQSYKITGHSEILFVTLIKFQTVTYSRWTIDTINYWCKVIQCKTLAAWASDISVFH